MLQEIEGPAPLFWPVGPKGHAVIERAAKGLIYTLGMFARLRVILVCLLTLALPVQGFAAATMLFCVGSSHHRGAAQVANLVAMSGVHEGGSMHEHPPGTLAHGHVGERQEGDANASAHADTDHAQHHGSSAKLDSQGKSAAKVEGKCSACSACCASVALPSTLKTFEPTKADSPLVATAISAAAGFFTDGQDRPPRISLA